MFKIHDVTIRNNTQNDVILIGDGKRPEAIAEERALGWSAVLTRQQPGYKR
jgi:hypothetical protein